MGCNSWKNAEKARAWGLEAELTAVPVDGLNLEASVGYSKFKYKEYMSLVGGTISNVADLARQTYSPKWNVRLAGQFDFPEFASGGHVMIRLDSRYCSAVDLGTFPPDTPELAALTVSKAHWTVDGRIGVVEIPIKGDMSASRSGTKTSSI